MEESRARILVVDDSEQDLRLHVSMLKGQGYEVGAATNAEEALLLIEAGAPDLLLIDADMPDIDGYTLCERLKEDGRYLDVPVIFSTESHTPEELDRGYAVGGVDTIVKPCHLSEFLARVRTHLHLCQLLQEVEQLREATIDTNPLTDLPGKNTITARFQEAIDQHLDLCVIAADLDNFKAYNDHYGFDDGDELLLFTAEILQSAIDDTCPDSGFLGNGGGDDFVLIVPTEHARAVSEQIVRTFDIGRFALYAEEDAERRFISTEDRLGNVNVFPFVSISLGGVLLHARAFTKAIEIAEVCSEVMFMAKRISGSNLFMDRRRGPLRKDTVVKRSERDATYNDGAADRHDADVDQPDTDAGKSDTDAGKPDTDADRPDTERVSSPESVE